MVDHLIWWIPLAPLLSAVCCAAMAVLRVGRTAAHVPALLGLGIAAALAIWIAFGSNPNDPILAIDGFNWMDVGQFAIRFGLRLDSVSRLMLLVIAPISFLVAAYSVGYMRGDAGYARYFAVFSAFVAAMTMLVLSRNLLALYFFWEGVGLCSYLLIGYWYQRESAAKAATKAFLVNRIADSGFLLGIVLLWHLMGSVQGSGSAWGRLEFDSIFAAVGQLSRDRPYELAAVAWLILLGAIGKSAQFPLYVWLPDAMAGPTPVSALIHAATMVTAGVYLVARMMPLLGAVPFVLVVAGMIGAITAILGAVLALFQHDLKRMLAFSTVSQLGYLFMALGCAAQSEFREAAIAAALFHLLTHAFFKALLFLSAGNVMHALHDEMDMRKFSGLRAALPWTHWMFLIGAAALAGVPPLAGFWSKDEILAAGYNAASAYDTSHWLAWIWPCALGGALITALYTSRAYFRVFWGPTKLPEGMGGHAHEATGSMLLPMAVLATGSLLVGVVAGPTGWLGRFLFGAEMEHVETHAPWWLIATSVCVVALGLGMGWRLSRGEVLVSNRFSAKGKRSMGLPGDEPSTWIDAAFGLAFVQPMVLLSQVGQIIESALIRVIDSIAGLVPLAGRKFRRLQNGKLAVYAVAMVLGVLVLLVWAVI